MLHVETKYGEMVVTKTATGIMAEKLETGVRLFVDGRYLPDSKDLVDIRHTIESIEYEYEFQHDIN